MFDSHNQYGQDFIRTLRCFLVQAARSEDRLIGKMLRKIRLVMRYLGTLTGVTENYERDPFLGRSLILHSRIRVLFSKVGRNCQGLSGGVRSCEGLKDARGKCDVRKIYHGLQ